MLACVYDPNAPTRRPLGWRHCSKHLHVTRFACQLLTNGWVLKGNLRLHVVTGNPSPTGSSYPVMMKINEAVSYHFQTHSVIFFERSLSPFLVTITIAWALQTENRMEFQILMQDDSAFHQQIFVYASPPFQVNGWSNRLDRLVMITVILTGDSKGGMSCHVFYVFIAASFYSSAFSPLSLPPPFLFTPLPFIYLLL